MKGLAKSLSNFTAFSARVYSLALSKGCKTGSALRGSLNISEERSLVHVSIGRDMALTFYKMLA